ncbi:MAG TPA: glycosyltransferase family 4 protein [Mycobacteriales bacterium]|nr:glycosyltransferase family 4 protein [Mycobacteriales bacterium]
MADRAVAGRRIGLLLATTAGGTGRHAAAVVDAVVAAGADVVVAGPAATESTFEFSSRGARFRVVEIATGLDPIADVAAWRVARGVLADREVVHAHGLRAGLVASAATPRSAGLVITWHNAVLAGGRSRRVLGLAERRVARRAAVTLCVSPDLVERVRELGGRDVRLAPVGSRAVPASGRAPADLRSDLGVEPGESLVLAIGRLHAQKGFDLLVRAAADLAAARDLTPRFVIAGDGPDRAALADAIALSGAPVDLLGWRSDTADLLAAADLVVMPSRWEGSPLSAHETLLAGRPLVATAVGGLPDLLGGGAARLIPPEDPAAIAAAVGDLLADDIERNALAERGRRRGLEWPDADTAARRVVDVYAELLGRR